MSRCLLGYCVGRIRCIFTIPASTVQQWFNEDASISGASSYFAYVDWFTPFSVSRMGEHHCMYQICYLRVQGEQQSSVIPINLITQSVHLFPKFGHVANADWKSSDVLDKAMAFFVNPFSNRFSYSTII